MAHQSDCICLACSEERRRDQLIDIVSQETVGGMAVQLTKPVQPIREDLQRVRNETAGCVDLAAWITAFLQLNTKNRFQANAIARIVVSMTDIHSDLVSEKKKY